MTWASRRDAKSAEERQGNIIVKLGDLCVLAGVKSKKVSRREREEGSIK